MDHVVRYQDGILFLKTKDRSWQDYVDMGKGRALGVEVMAKKTTRSLNGVGFLFVVKIGTSF